MRYTISGKNINITPGLKDAVESKLGKLERYFYPDTEGNIKRRERTSENRGYDSCEGQHYPC